MAAATAETLTLDDLRASERGTITRTEAAQVLGVNARTVTTGIEEGNIPAIKVGRRRVIPRERFIHLFE